VFAGFAASRHLLLNGLPEPPHRGDSTPVASASMPHGSRKPGDNQASTDCENQNSLKSRLLPRRRSRRESFKFLSFHVINSMPFHSLTLHTGIVLTTESLALQDGEEVRAVVNQNTRKHRSSFINLTIRYLNHESTFPRLFSWLAVTAFRADLLPALKGGAFSCKAS